MTWLEVSVEVDPEVAEAVAEVLSRYVDAGVAIEAGPDGWHAGPVIVRAYLPDDDERWAKRKQIQEGLWHLGQIATIPDPAFRSVAEEDWTEAWKKQLRVLRVGERIVIQPSWLDYIQEPKDVVIRLDPGMAFGTGLHPTTQMCLLALEELVRPGMDVLDMGTGSGILAIAAAKLGARRVLGVDSDSQSARVARSNVISNGVQQTVQIKRGSLSDVAGVYDLLVVNILARVILELVEEGLCSRMRRGAFLVGAGITSDRAPEVITTLERHGLEILGQRRQDDWVTLLAKRPQMRSDGYSRSEAL